ncbi:NAD-dependent epimerase/dehydratase family protein [Actinophytocola sp.]|uniref:NAD-dependent epimerase/dehydratase family protein n=1 Tax=Actinophytocola sp. TaxID=1872138 RepID=UPI002D5087A0|nr:NAD-dependent epimerase/dehydratase family protein [Actinophytocola sp.]HYQ63647.1 NAD-dependent epimerase/dehydratase family protein [Actinophytocola sp.]
MRLLVLGGTIFVGYAVASEALRRGHDVVCAARGESGSVPDGARLVRVDRDAEDGLASLAGESYDAVVDVSPLSYPWVRRALDTLGERAAHWTFVSTVNVYADVRTPDQTPATGPLVPPLEQHATREEMMAAGEDGILLYGGIKVASENAVRDAMGDRAFVVRPGLITGSWDRSDRFGYWPGRFARGGRVLVPDFQDQRIQLVDVRDFATWIVDAGEQGVAGTFDAVGPHRPTSTVIEEIAAAVGFDGELVRATADQLAAAGVNPWGGPRSLPLWVPDEYDGFKTHDPTPSLRAGMPVRPFADAVADALERERELGLDRERRAGLSLDEEKEVLAKL